MKDYDTNKSLRLDAVKYIHILFAGVNGWIFIRNLMETLNDQENGFDVSEQLFVTSCRPLYNKMVEAGYTNIAFFPEKINNSVNVINYYGNKCNWLFVHGMTSILDSFKIKREIRNKIIWRTWGHDTGYNYYGCGIKSLIKQILNLKYRNVVRSFYAVGISETTVDRMNIQRKFGDVRLLNITYSSISENEALKRAYHQKSKTNETYNIVIGHSGHAYENHIKILDKLERFVKDEIMIYIPLAYGDLAYIGFVENYIESCKYKDKIKILRELLPYEQYAEFLNNMDLAIFDGLGSAALGNIIMLRYLGKKLCVNRDGIVHEALIEDRIPHITIDELETISFKDLRKNIEITEEQRNILIDPIASWHNVYNSLS